VKSCDDIRLLLGALLDGELDTDQSTAVREHASTCDECCDLLAAMETIDETLASLREIAPPNSLLEEVAYSPCRRWLGLLSQAIDREISQTNLDRLISHLEGCETCRQTWSDLSLIHQIGEALEPPPSLLQKCVAARIRVPRSRVLGRRAATAAAYFLAVLTSILVANPVTLGRSPSSETVQKVANTVSVGVAEVAEESRSEARMMLWRAWNWGERQVEAVQDILTQLKDDESDTQPAKEVQNERNDND
jgi:predicted anti-sigma-YlaC factor YlaD